MDTDHDKVEFKVGDRIYCDKKKKYGFVSRLNPLGCKKTLAIGIHWDDKTRDIIFGHAACCELIKK